jgi:hypothetical protein
MLLGFCRTGLAGSGEKRVRWGVKIARSKGEKEKKRGKENLRLLSGRDT